MAHKEIEEELKEEIEASDKSSTSNMLGQWRSEYNRLINIVKWRNKFGFSYSLSVGRVRKGQDVPDNERIRFLTRRDLLCIRDVIDDCLHDKIEE